MAGGPEGGRDRLPDRLIEQIIATSPDHQAGTRATHAPAIGVTGRFYGSEVAAASTEAPHLAGGCVPVTVRFSNGTGSMREADTQPFIRGMAIRFHVSATPASPPADADPDMVCMTLPLFVARTLEEFRKFTEASQWTKVKPTAVWRTYLDYLRLRPRPNTPLTSGLVAAIRYANQNPQARPAVASLSTLSLPESFVTATYHAVHAFVLTADGRECRARFRFEPVAGVRTLAQGTEGNYLHGELRRRLAREPAEFVLRMQVAEQGDDTSDPTTPWPDTRRRVVMGHLFLDRVIDDQSVVEGMAFDPTRLAPGISLGDDPIPLARSRAYAMSVARRRAESDA